MRRRAMRTWIVLDTKTLERVMGTKPYKAVIHLAAITERRRRRLKTSPGRLSGECPRHPRNGESGGEASSADLLSITRITCSTGASAITRSRIPRHPQTGTAALETYAGELEVQDMAGGWARSALSATSFRSPAACWHFPTAYTKVYTSADFTVVMAGDVAECMARDLRGIIHMGTPVKRFFDIARQRNPQIQPEECTDPAFPQKTEFEH